MQLQVDVPFSGSQYNLAMEMIGIPTVGWAADQSATFPGSVKELVVTPAELLGLLGLLGLGMTQSFLIECEEM
jgi:hypothetical protein